MNEGMNRREARERAEREFGDVARARRELRTADEQMERVSRRRVWFDDLRQDLTHAVRTLCKRPGFTAVAVAILALGIGASVAMFTVLNAVVLRPLPYPEPNRLVRVAPGQNMNITLSDAVTDASPSLAAASGLSTWGLTLTGEGEPAARSAQTVDPGFFDVVQVRPALGRPFVEGDRDPARSDIVLLSHGFWQAQFGGDPDIVGRRIELDGYDHATREVIGVMPEGFQPPLTAPGEEIAFWIPFNLPPGKTFASDSSWYVSNTIARLAPGATVEQAAQEVRAAIAGMRDRHPGLIAEDAVRAAGAAGLLDSMVGDVRGTLWLMLAAVSLVLLLACANLANLLLARAEGERGGLAVRAALGATRLRLVRQQLTHGLVLAVAGGAAGTLLGRGLLAALEVGAASGLPRTVDLTLDGRVLAFALGASLLSVLAFGLLPALRATAGDLRDDLTAGGRGAARPGSSHRVSRALVAAEIALAVVVVAGAALMLNSFRTLRSVDPGMDVDDVLALWLAPKPNAYQDRERTRTFYDQVAERLAGLPGVRTVGAIHLLPFTDNNWSFPYLAEGHAPPEDGPLPSANFRVVTPGYFETVDIPLLAGRDVAATDRSDGSRVTVINQTFARELWPGEDPLGRTIRIFGNVDVRVVGVVGDVRQHALDREPLPEMYMPLAQWRVTSMVVMLEAPDAASLTSAAREAVWAVDDDVPVVDARPLADAMADSVERQRFFTGVLTVFGLLALTLGAIGVYGVTAFTVRARLPEFGVRVAMGATPGEVRRHALATGLAPVAVGLVVGLAGAFAAARLLASLLYGVGAADPATFATVAGTLAVVAVAATLIPAGRAARVDPATVLRAE